jgi:hypothetical protein
MARKKKNKSQLIRDYKAKHPSARPIEIIKALKAHKISAALVGNVLHRAKHAKGKKGRRKMPKASHNGAAVSLESLLAAKKLVEQLGGVEHAKSALSVLEKLG